MSDSDKKKPNRRDFILTSTTAAGAVVGLVVGHSIGETFDKIDQLHAALVLQTVLDNTADGVYSHWRSD